MVAASKKLVVVPAVRFYRAIDRLNEHIPNDVYTDLSAIMCSFAEGVISNDFSRFDINTLRKYVNGWDHASVEYAIDLFLENHHTLHFMLATEMKHQVPWLIQNNYNLESLLRLPGSDSMLLRVYHESKTDFAVNSITRLDRPPLS